MSVPHLDRAKRARNDEFYTPADAVWEELRHYDDEFRGRVVACPCDCEASEFVRYFRGNFDRLNLRGLLVSGFARDGSDNTDFRSAEAAANLAAADIVVTNPPFSLLGEFVDTMRRAGKRFLFLGGAVHGTSFPFATAVAAGDLWRGMTRRSVRFAIPNGETTPQPIRWWTNIDNGQRPKPLSLTTRYTPKRFRYYDNFPAIEVPNCKIIPGDFPGLMGVPISFLDKWCPQQFEILGSSISLGLAQPCLGGEYPFGRFIVRNLFPE